MVDSTMYTYGTDLAKDDLKTITWKDSKGITFKNEYLYNYDYSISTSSPAYLGDLQYLLTSRTWKVNSGSSDELIGCQSMRPLKVSNKIFTQSVFSGTVSAGQTTTDDNTAIVNNASTPNLLKAVETTEYDSKGYPVEVRIGDNEVYASAIWDSRIAEKIAECSNARHEQIAYTSFEGGGYSLKGTLDDFKGNWDFDTSNAAYRKYIQWTLSCEWFPLLLFKAAIGWA